MSGHQKNGIFIDGANVAREYLCGKQFSVIGLLRCAVYFRQRDFPTKIILHRNWRALASNGRLEDGDQLVKLESGSAGVIIYTPIGSDDKEFLIQMALDHSGIIVTNDTFEGEKAERKDWAHFLNKRCLPFRFVNHEFSPLPPNVDGQVMEVDEFLNSTYQVSSETNSAAALANYLLTMNVDDTEDRSGNDRMRDADRRRQRISGPIEAPLRRYTVGQITEVSTESGRVEFQIKKDGQATTTQFDAAAYHPNGRVTHDLRREFHVGDWIGFISEKPQERGRWKIVEVRKKSEMRRGYGRYRPLTTSASAAAGIIEPRYKADAGGGDVFFPGASFRDDGMLLTNLPRGYWLYYYAFDQKPSAGCTAVSVEVFSATTAGVVVKKTDQHIYIWSSKTGLARGDAVEFPEGTWVKFGFQQERGHTRWTIHDLEKISPPAGIKVEVENLDSSNENIVHIRCPAVVGVITEKYGSIWTEAFGRMVLPTSCLKHVLTSEPAGLQPYHPVRIWAMFGGDYSVTESGDGTTITTSANASRPTTSEMPWRVISLIASSGATASGAEPPYPPPSVIFGVEATVLHIEETDSGIRGQHFICKSEKYGRIYATPLDLIGSQKQLSIGDRVKASIIPQPLRYGDEYRAFVIEKVPGPITPVPAQGEISRNSSFRQIE